MILSLSKHLFHVSFSTLGNKNVFFERFVFAVNTGKENITFLISRATKAMTSQSSLVKKINASGSNSGNHCCSSDDNNPNFPKHKILIFA